MAKILLIDDEDTFRKSIKMVLSREGHEVIEATDGAMGKEILDQNEDADAVIMDVIMPNKGGIETLMESYSDFDNSKIILMTGKVSPGEKFTKIVSHFGAKHILYKPIERQLLLETLDKVINH